MPTVGTTQVVIFGGLVLQVCPQHRCRQAGENGAGGTEPPRTAACLTHMLLQHHHRAVERRGFVPASPECSSGTVSGATQADGLRVYCSFFFFGSPAEKYALRPRHWLASVNGRPTPDLDTLLEAVGRVASPPCPPVHFQLFHTSSKLDPLSYAPCSHRPGGWAAGWRTGPFDNDRHERPAARREHENGPAILAGAEHPLISTMPCACAAILRATLVAPLKYPPTGGGASAGSRRGAKRRQRWRLDIPRCEPGGKQCLTLDCEKNSVFSTKSHPPVALF